MMKELFNLEKFEFYYKVVSRGRTTRNDSITRVTATPRRWTRANYSCSESLSALEKEVHELNKGLQEQQREEKLGTAEFSRNAAARKECDGLTKQAPYYQKLREKSSDMNRLLSF